MIKHTHVYNDPSALEADGPVIDLHGPQDAERGGRRAAGDAKVASGGTVNVAAVTV